MKLPTPEAGLVIGYSYLWAREHSAGRQEGVKNRPCAIVAARQVIEGREVVTVIPITHTPPNDPADAVEIPAALKAHLGLDEHRSWAVVTETNDGLGLTFDPFLVGRLHGSTTACCLRASSPTSATRFCRRTFAASSPLCQVRNEEPAARRWSSHQPQNRTVADIVAADYSARRNAAPSASSTRAPRCAR